MLGRSVLPCLLLATAALSAEPERPPVVLPPRSGAEADLLRDVARLKEEREALARESAAPGQPGLETDAVAASRAAAEPRDAATAARPGPDRAAICAGRRRPLPGGPVPVPRRPPRR